MPTAVRELPSWAAAALLRRRSPFYSSSFLAPASIARPLQHGSPRGITGRPENPGGGQSACRRRRGRRRPGPVALCGEHGRRAVE